MLRFALRSGVLALFVIASCVVLPGSTLARDIVLTMPETGNYTIHVTSYAQIPFRTVFRQEFDYSCGSAALATLLHFQYGKDSDEAQVFKAMYAHASYSTRGQRA